MGDIYSSEVEAEKNGDRPIKLTVDLDGNKHNWKKEFIVEKLVELTKKNGQHVKPRFRQVIFAGPPEDSSRYVLEVNIPTVQGNPLHVSLSCMDGISKQIRLDLSPTEPIDDEWDSDIAKGFSIYSFIANIAYAVKPKTGDKISSERPEPFDLDLLKVDSGGQ